MLPERVLLIGGNGFIGRALALCLAEVGYEVHVLSRHVEPGRSKGIEFHRGSQDAAEVVVPLLKRCESVVHLASDTTPGSSAHSPKLEIRENLEPLAGFIEALATVGPRRILYLSSGGAIYGNPDSLPVTEDHPCRPLSWHATGKVMAESMFCAHARQISGTSLVILRPSNVYGSGQALQSGFGVVCTLMEKARYGAGIDIWGDGSQIRDFLYIDDLVDACMRILAAPEVTGVFNAGSGVGTSLLELVRLTERVTGRSVPVSLHPKRDIDVAGIWLDSHRLHTATGWRAATTLAQGMVNVWAELAQGEDAER